MVKVNVLSHCKSCKGHNLLVVVMDQGLVKVVGFPLGMGNSSVRGKEGGGSGLLVVRRKTETPKRIRPI